MSKAVSKAWVFASSSGSGKYQTLLYSDGTTSCECKGWTRRVAADGSRSCRHTRAIDMGTADSEALSHHDYTATVPITTQPLITKHATKKEINSRELGQRKFHLK
ncbi:MAG TPA: hypothetical protein VNU68_04455 [Verrucomicrobiae bacterium]|nr:hypothetical protein [Verrucomicrobiae bacterium]